MMALHATFMHKVACFLICFDLFLLLVACWLWAMFMELKHDTKKQRVGTDAVLKNLMETEHEITIIAKEGRHSGYFIKFKKS